MIIHIGFVQFCLRVCQLIEDKELFKSTLDSILMKGPTETKVCEMIIKMVTYCLDNRNFFMMYTGTVNLCKYIVVYFRNWTYFRCFTLLQTSKVNGLWIG